MKLKQRRKHQMVKSRRFSKQNRRSLRRGQTLSLLTNAAAVWKSNRHIPAITTLFPEMEAIFG